MNQSLSLELLKQCHQLGIRHFIVCAGSRNAPLLAELAASENIVVENFFEERSAAFYALGLSKKLNAPVAVLTTSGTAAAELFPALIEAYYSGVPLLALTADLPSAFHNSGAPQCIEQKNIFGLYVQECQDAETPENIQLNRWTRQGPFHVNLRFAEPLIPIAPRGWVFSSIKSNPPQIDPKTPPPIPSEVQSLLKNFHKNARHPIVILGGLDPEERFFVKKLCLSLNLPIYAEAHSGLREDKELAPLILRSGEKILQIGLCESVLRMGSVPTLRFWRDLEGIHKNLPVYSLSSKRFSGLSRESSFAQMNFSNYSHSTLKIPTMGPTNPLLDFDRWYLDIKLEMFSEYPQCESALIHRLSRKLQPQSRIFLGNSLAIRHWDFAADFKDKGFEIFANRGANGIDGELSTFLGLADPKHFNHAIVGDLTALYDLSAPWAVRNTKDLPFVIYVINNFGGRIFSDLKHYQDHLATDKRESWVENTHQLNFQNWAQLWNLGYEKWESIPSFDVAAKQSVVEINPNPQDERDFKKALKDSWAGAATKIALSQKM